MDGKEFEMDWWKWPVILLFFSAAGCAGMKQEVRHDLDLMAKKAEEVQKEEVSGTPRFSKSAISDAQMLQGRSAQEYRDSVIP